MIACGCGTTNVIRFEGRERRDRERFRIIAMLAGVATGGLSGRGGWAMFERIWTLAHSTSAHAWGSGQRRPRRRSARSTRLSELSAGTTRVSPTLPSSISCYPPCHRHRRPLMSRHRPSVSVIVPLRPSPSIYLLPSTPIPVHRQPVPSAGIPRLQHMPTHALRTSGMFGMRLHE